MPSALHHIRPLLPALLAAALAAAPAAAAQQAPAPQQPPAVAPAPVQTATAGELASRAEALADEVVERWAGRQDPGGGFPDPVIGLAPDYGTSMLGLAMARRGEATRDAALLRAGLRAIAHQLALPTRGSFELLTLARAYAWGQRALAPEPRWRSSWAAVEPQLRAHLAAHGPVASTARAANCTADPSCYNNLKLVSGLAEYELQRSGVTPAGPSSLLADPALATRVIERLTVRVPSETGRRIRRSGRSALAGAGLLSDPPRNPLAYHALSTAVLGQQLQELGGAAPKPAMRAFERAARGLLLLAAPDGDLSWYGRGQGQVWVSAVVVEAASIAALRTTSPRLRTRYLALAETSLQRLRTAYGVGEAGLPLVPGGATADVLAGRGVDAYATTRSYNGLAVDALDRATRVLRRVPDDLRASVLPATLQGVVQSPDQARLVTLTRGPLWAGIAARSGSPRDARYGSGLLALQARDAAGRWAPVGAAQPMDEQVLGTLAIRQRDRLLVPRATVKRVTGAGVDLVGAWGAPDARSRAPGTVWSWRMLPAGAVEVRFTARGSYAVVAGGVMPDGAAMTPAPDGFAVTSPDGTALDYAVSVNGRRPGMTRWTHRTRPSAYHAQPGVARLQLRVRRGDRVALRITVRGLPPAAAAAGGR